MLKRTTPTRAFHARIPASTYKRLQDLIKAQEVTTKSECVRKAGIKITEAVSRYGLSKIESFHALLVDAVAKKEEEAQASAPDPSDPFGGE